MRTACAEALAFIGQRFPEATQALQAQLLPLLRDPKLDQEDRFVNSHTVQAYVFDALWLISSTPSQQI